VETHLGHSTSTEHEKTRNIFFDDPLFEEFALRPLIMDGCPLGEISATASLIEDGDRDGWFRKWTAAADRVAGYGDASAHADHTISASGAYVRASSYYRAAYLPLYGSPVDPRLVEAFDKEAAAFQKAAALMPSPVEPVELPFEGTTLPGYFCRVDDSDRPRSTLICTNGLHERLRLDDLRDVHRLRGCASPWLQPAALRWPGARPLADPAGPRDEARLGERR